jgi:hypothetical protein
MSLADLLRRAFGRAPKPTGPTCLACDSRQVEMLAHAAYRCHACGHEGGDGLPAYLADRRRSELLALPEAERLALARRNLEAARNLLTGVDPSWAPISDGAQMAVQVAGALGGPIVRAGLAAVTNNRKDDIEDQERQNLRIIRDLMEAETLLDEAATALGQRFVLRTHERLANVSVSGKTPQVRAHLVTRARALLAETDRLSSSRG